MKARAMAVTAVVTIGLTLAACGDDDSEGGTDTTSESAATNDPSPSTDVPPPETTPDDTSEPTTTTTPPETTSTETTSGETTDTTGGATAELTGDEAAVAEVYKTVFDSTIPVADKLDLVEDGAELESTLDEYATAGEMVGGIGLEVTDVAIDGEVAALTYDLTFAGTPQYDGLDGEVVSVDGEWTIARTEFCDFVGQARVSCP